MKIEQRAGGNLLKAEPIFVFAQARALATTGTPFPPLVCLTPPYSRISYTPQKQAHRIPHMQVKPLGPLVATSAPSLPPPLRAFVHADAAGAVICGLILLVNFALSRRNSPKRQRARLAESSRLSTRFKKPGARSHLGCVCV